jgi:hypothetical protein
MTDGERFIWQLGKVAEKRFGLTVGENPHFGGVDPVHTDGSFHYSALAIDVTGPPARLAAFNRYVARYFGNSIAELFYDPGISIDNGTKIGPIGGHGSHVHVAADANFKWGGGKQPGGDGWDLPGAEWLGDNVPGFQAGADLLDQGLDAALDGAADAVPDVAGDVISGLAKMLGVNANAIMLNVALIGGGALLIYYGVAKAAGVDAPVRQIYGRTPAGAAVGAAV